MFLVTKQIGIGTTVTCFYNGVERKTLNFNNNHIFAIQDVIHQKHPEYNKIEHNYEKLML